MLRAQRGDCPLPVSRQQSCDVLPHRAKASWERSSTGFKLSGLKIIFPNMLTAAQNRQKLVKVFLLRSPLYEPHKVKLRRVHNSGDPGGGGSGGVGLKSTTQASTRVTAVAVSGHTFAPATTCTGRGRGRCHRPNNWNKSLDP